jgi:hypothetical protein
MLRKMLGTVFFKMMTLSQKIILTAETTSNSDPISTTTPLYVKTKKT